MKRKVLLLVVLVIAALVAWRLIAARGHRSPAPLVLYGNVDIREVNLGFRVPGRIVELLKEEGDPVQPGELLARLDDGPYRRQVEQARAQVAALKAKLAQLESGYRKEEIERARATLDEAKASLENAVRLYNRRKELVRTNAVPQQDFDDALSARDQAQARLASASANLTLLEAGYRPEEIEQGRADLQRAEAVLAEAEISLADTELTAPSRGVAITRALEPGTIVQAGATVLTVSLTEPVWVRAYVSEPDLGRVHPGMRAQVYADFRPGKPFEGQVGFISPRAEFTPKTVETADLRTSLVYRLRIVIPAADEALRQGMPVTVKFP